MEYTYEYTMSKTLANTIIADARKHGKKNEKPQTILCDFVNTEMGLLLKCSKVNING